MANFNFSKSVEVVGSGHELMGGKASKTNRIRIRRDYNEIWALEKKITGRNFKALLTAYSRLIAIRDYFVPYLQSDPARVTKGVNLINDMLKKLATIWSDNVKLALTPYRALTLGSKDPNVIGDFIIRMDDEYNSLYDAIPPALIGMVELRKGVKIYDDLSQTLAEHLASYTGGPAPVAKSDKSKLKTFNNPYTQGNLDPDPNLEPEPPSLLIPVAVGVGALGLILALKG